MERLGFHLIPFSIFNHLNSSVIRRLPRMLFICQVLENSLDTFFPQRKAPCWKDVPGRKRETLGSPRSKAFLSWESHVLICAVDKTALCLREPLRWQLSCPSEGPKAEGQRCVTVVNMLFIIYLFLAVLGLPCCEAFL